MNAPKGTKGHQNALESIFFGLASEASDFSDFKDSRFSGDEITGGIRGVIATDAIVSGSTLAGEDIGAGDEALQDTRVLTLARAEGRDGEPAWL